MAHGKVSEYNKGCRCDLCRAASKKASRAYYERHREAILAKTSEYQRSRPERKEYEKRWYRENKERLAGDRRQKRLANYEEARKAEKEREARIPREIRRERGRAYYERCDKKARREQNKVWRKTPSGRAYVARSRRRRSEVPYTQEALAWIASLVDPTCHYCGSPATEIDHVVPVTRGGTGERDNLVPACRSCNASKNNKLLSEWKGEPIGSRR